MHNAHLKHGETQRAIEGGQLPLKTVASGKNLL